MIPLYQNRWNLSHSTAICKKAQEERGGQGHLKVLFCPPTRKKGTGSPITCPPDRIPQAPAEGASTPLHSPFFLRGGLLDERLNLVWVEVRNTVRTQPFQLRSWLPI